MERRAFLKASAIATGGVFMAPLGARGEVDVPEAIRALRPMTDGIVPISDKERWARIEKARLLMVNNGIDAIYIEPGSSLFYYTGVRWWPSERMFSLVMPARGDLAWISPAFEESRARELIRFGTEIRTWEEDESPYKKVIQLLKDRGIGNGRIGIEEETRFFLYEGLRKEGSWYDYVSADPVTVGCRVIKSEAEIALMQRANDITLAAFRAAHAILKEGMTAREFGSTISGAFKALGVEGGAMVGFGKSTAFPHGSRQPQVLTVGDVVLIDGGCSVEGYASDITRTFVFGEPTERQREVWNLERRAQDAALAAARVGVACEAVDAAARKVITDAGFGPGYKLPGLPHRTGHGIGLDDHEWTYLVRGNTTPIEPGMCFSNEPTIVIEGEFGVRLEDCMYVTENGARMFTQQSESIDRPFD